ncbi:hypothetical protein Q8A67_009943 [Cirrhinus molitorella]|uniref:Uncharacterized protein n=1 Tax=Cirrhinus molitorella TaxID=172907 RepID=A0AA88PYJ8_9TELE|nr:hypothetical protein Q8A67_009943 [Cirrhinus molitorella]
MLHFLRRASFELPPYPSCIPQRGHACRLALKHTDFFLAPSFTSTLLLSSSLPPTCFYITLFSMRSTLPYMSQLIGPAAQLKFTIATMIQSPSNGFYFHPTSYSGTPISQQPTVQWMNLLISDKV